VVIGAPVTLSLSDDDRVSVQCVGTRDELADGGNLLEALLQKIGINYRPTDICWSHVGDDSYSVSITFNRMGVGADITGFVQRCVYARYLTPHAYGRFPV
jgi:hypothetical protein